MIVVVIGLSLPLLAEGMARTHFYRARPMPRVGGGRGQQGQWDTRDSTPTPRCPSVQTGGRSLAGCVVDVDPVVQGLEADLQDVGRLLLVAFEVLQRGEYQ